MSHMRIYARESDAWCPAEDEVSNAKSRGSRRRANIPREGRFLACIISWPLGSLQENAQSPFRHTLRARMLLLDLPLSVAM